MKTYYVNDNFEVIPKPDVIKLGQTEYEPHEDCEYMLFHKGCPNGSDYTENCPLLIGDPPCKNAKKCILIEIGGYPGDKIKTKQLKLM